MTLSEARTLSGYTPEDVVRIFGVSYEELLALESTNDHSAYKDLLIRSILCNPLTNAENVCLIVAPKAAICDGIFTENSSLIVRFPSVDEALRAFPQFEDYRPEPSSINERFYETSVWLCDEAGKPKTPVKRMVKEF